MRAEHWMRAAPREPAEGGGIPRREQFERVDVRLSVADPDPEMDVRHVVLGFARGAEVRDSGTLGDRRALARTERPEMRERDLVAVAGLDRHREAMGRNRAGERHATRRRGADRM